MPDLTPDLSVDLAGWIARLNHLRDDIAFGLDLRGVTATLNDVVNDMQHTRKQTER